MSIPKWYNFFGGKKMNMTLRLEYELYNKLKEIAFKEKRSINAQINFIIQEYIKKTTNF